MTERDDVTMDDAFGMGGVERVRHLNGVTQRFLKRQRALELLALYQFHDEVIGAYIVERTNVGMVQCGNGVRFPFEALGEMFRGNLYGDGPIQPRISRLVHLAHAARSDRRKNLVGSQAKSGSQRHRIS